MKFIVAALIATVAAECGDPMITSMSMYSDDKCEKEVEGLDDDAKKKALDEANKGAASITKCTAAGDVFMQLTCSTEKASVEFFKDKECSEKADAPKGTPTTEFVWGECTKAGEGVWMKVTGANALAATVAASAALLATLY